MRALVTGSTGLLGNNLVRRLLADGHDVVALARSAEKARRELGDTAARVVVADITAADTYADALAGVDVVFHTAAFFREYYTPGDHAAPVERANVAATLDLARAARAQGVAKLIHTSSAGLIGLEADGRAGTESTPPWSGAAGNLYLQSKLSAERALREYSLESGLFVAFALPSWMWGPRDAAPTPSGQLVRDALLRRLPPAVPPGGSSVVDARDVAAGMLRIAEAGRSGRRYILSAGYMDLADILRHLAHAAGVAAPARRLPYPVAMGLAGMAEAWSRIRGVASPLSREGVRLMNARLAVRADRAAAELGVTFRPFEETVADTVAWTRARWHGETASVPALHPVAGRRLESRTEPARR